MKTGEHREVLQPIPETDEEIAAYDERECASEIIDRRASFGDRMPGAPSMSTPIERPPGGPNRAQRRRRKRRDGVR